MANRPSLLDLGELARSEIERSISAPNLLTAQPWGEQIDFHKSNAIGRYLSGGNQGGKTHALVSEFLWLASDTHPYRQRPKTWGTGPFQGRIVCVDVDEGLYQILLPKFKQLTPRSMLIDGSWDKSWDPGKYILTFENGAFIDFLTYKMDLQKFGGVQRHAIGFDEEPPQDIFNESMPRLYRFKGIWIISATNTKGITWTYDSIIEPKWAGAKTHEKIDVFELDATKNPHLQVGMEERGPYQLAMSESERQIRDQGKIIAREGFVFPEFLNKPGEPGSHVVEHHWPGKGCRFYSSVDHGVKNATAWLWHAVYPDGSIFTFAEHFQSDLNIKQHAAIVKQREREWRQLNEGGYWFRGVDVRTGDPAMKQREGTSGMNPIQAYAMEGIGIYVDNIPRDVTVGIDKMHTYFALREDGTPTWTISNQCVNLIRELRKLQWDTYESTRAAYGHNPKEEVKKVDDHAFDSARYFATLMPNLTPGQNSLRSDEPAVTLNYSEVMVMLADQGYLGERYLSDYDDRNQVEYEEY